MNPTPASRGGTEPATKDRDILEHLHDDHQNVLARLQQLDAAATAKRRELLFADVKAELAAHIKAEDDVFYKVLEQANGELITDARYEHKNIAALLERLDGLPKDGAEWTSMLAELCKAVGHHVRRDESAVFRAARQTLTREELCQLVARMAEGEVQRKALAGESHAVAREAQEHT